MPGRPKSAQDIPATSALAVSEAIARLLDARDRVLAHMSTDDVITTIDEAIAGLLDQAGDLWHQIVEGLASSSGYSRPMLERGLPYLLSPFRREGLVELVRSEFGGMAPPRGMLAPPLTVHILSGNIPSIGVESIVRGLLAGSACLVKPSSDEPLVPGLFAEALGPLKECVTVLRWQGGDEAIERTAFNGADAVIAYGADAAIEDIRGRMPEGVTFIAHGHRIGFGAIGRERLADKDLPHLAREAAWDVAFFDQQGCVSPHAFFVERGGASPPLAFAKALAEALDTLETEIPRGRLTAAEASAIHQTRTTWEMRRASGQPVELFSSEGSTAWTVLYEEDAHLGATCLNRTVRVIAVDRLETIPGLITEHSRHLQTAGVAVGLDRYADLSEMLTRAGVTRVCPIGQMQHPPASWRHDGGRPLLDLLRDAKG